MVLMALIMNPSLAISNLPSAVTEEITQTILAPMMNVQRIPRMIATYLVKNLSIFVPLQISISQTIMPMISNGLLM